MARISWHDIDRAITEHRNDGRHRPTSKPKKTATKHDRSSLVEREPVASSLALPQLRQNPGDAPVRAWARQVDEAAWRQLSRVAALPIIHPHGLAVMPDVHVGNGVCVGSVIPTRGAVIPSTVGLDAGCGMVALALDLQANQLPDSLHKIRMAIEAAVPLGTGGMHRDIANEALWAPLAKRYESLVAGNRALFKRTAGQQLGTLGAGNHFIEVCLDESSRVWVMIHSGSRGAGALIGQHFIAQAKLRSEREGLALSDKGLGWLSEGTPEFESYIQALLWAQDYARDNRKVMMERTLRVLSKELGMPLRVVGEAVNAHHNYVARETHFGEDLWITRKGAIRAGAGDLGIIPGSMGAQSFIVRGKGVEASYCSCSHGAGRAMNRAEARERFTTRDLKEQTQGIECRKDSAIIDEAPHAYKPIREVMADQRDLVEVVHTLRQVVCVKGN